jgi:FkbM family methyltransferase
MPLTSLMKRVVRRALANRGYRISRIPAAASAAAPAAARLPVVDRSSMRGALQSLARRLPEVATIIDMGASDGSWSELALEYYPGREVLLIEAQPVHTAGLQGFCARHANARYVLAAAGAAPGEIYFNADQPLGGMAAYTPFPENNVVVPVTTVDEQVRQQRLSGPFLLKLDTHGFELPILTGAAATLRQTAAVIMEVYNFKIGADAVVFVDMALWLREQGFRCLDVVDLWRRPKDDAFWQMDMVFVRADRPEFQDMAYN